jgi:arylsulfatase A
VQAPLPGLPIDGVDLGGVWFGSQTTSPRTTLFYWWGKELQAVRHGTWKLHFPHAYRTLAGPPGEGGARVPDAVGHIGLALFDLARDPGERTDVAALHPDVVEQLQTLADWARRELGDSAVHQQGRAVRSD